MLNFLLFLLSPIFALAGVTNLIPTANTNTGSGQNFSYYSTASCWSPEPTVKIDITASDLDNVHNQPLYMSQPPCHGGVQFTPYGGADGLIGSYTRVRQNVIFENYKIDTEGKPFFGGCANGTSALRWVANVGGKRVFWENVNRKGEKMYDFIFVESQSPDNRYYYMEVYARDSIINDPAAAGYQFILDCETTGGIVPVVETKSDILPPQVVAFTELSQTPQETANYNNFAIPVNVSPQPTGKVGPTLPATYELFPPYMHYLIKIDKEGLPTAALIKGDIGTVTRTSKGTTHTYTIYFHAGAFYLRDQQDGQSYIYDTSADAPDTALVRNPSLQLGVLKFRLTYEWNPFQPTCKPAIYLYPTRPTDLNVKVIPEGYITKSLPDYNGGWNVRAYPDGSLYELGGTNQELRVQNDYLFYEANIENVAVPKEGWVVSQQELSLFLDKMLTQLGLNSKEAGDFKSYWLGRLTGKPYYFITLLPEDTINQKEQLVFSQKPDTLIRVRFLFEGLTAPISVLPLHLPSTPRRNGFTAVDWGGGVVGGSCEDGVVKSQSIH